MAPTDVDLFEMADTAVARRNGYVLELHIHIVFGFDQLSAVRLAGCNLERDNVALLSRGLEQNGTKIGPELGNAEVGGTHLSLVEELNWDANC